MQATLDSVGRIVVPKPLRDALGLKAGSQVDTSFYGAGLQIVPSGRVARLVDEAGVLVVDGDTDIDDEDVFGLIDAGRRFRLLPDDVVRLFAARFARPLLLTARTARRVPEILVANGIAGGAVYDAPTVVLGPPQKAVQHPCARRRRPAALVVSR